VFLWVLWFLVYLHRGLEVLVVVEVALLCSTVLLAAAPMRLHPLPTSSVVRHEGHRAAWKVANRCDGVVGGLRLALAQCSHVVSARLGDLLVGLVVEREGVALLREKVEVGRRGHSRRSCDYLGRAASFNFYPVFAVAAASSSLQMRL